LKLQDYAAVVTALIRDRVEPKRGLATSLRKRLSIEIAHSFAGKSWDDYDMQQRAILVEKCEATAKRLAEKSVAILKHASDRGLNLDLVLYLPPDGAQKQVLDWFRKLGITSQDSLFEVFGFAK
jgi:hypothetical protein